MTKGDDIPPISNPMLNANYSEDAEVPFVGAPKRAMGRASRQASFESESASRRTREMADWVVSSKDNLNMPFAIVDKVNAQVYVFDVDGQLRGSAPVLLGLGKGDHVAPGTANKPMSLIPPSQRTTPAGRFVSAMGPSLHGKEILWLDYENAISMHPVATSKPKERRVERLESPTPLDNRISFGCINVPAKFFDNVIHSTFSGTSGIVYVLPEEKPVKES
ncbi:L,D-transpeptidase [Thiocystis violacea]|nr:L,D-transpeptidase [Thiocystis violacea]